MVSKSDGKRWESSNNLKQHLCFLFFYTCFISGNVLKYLLDRDKNSKIASFLDVKEGLISTADSKVPVYVIPTDEEVVIARDAYNFAK